MKIQKPKKLRLGKGSQRLRYMAVALVAVVGSYFVGQSLAAPGTIYVAPSSATKLVGETFTVQVRIAVSSPINAAFVNMTYDASGLQVLGVQRGGGFPNQNAPTQLSSGSIKMQSTRSNSTTGDLHYANITFKGLKTGSFKFNIQTSSKLINYPTNEVAYTVAGATYTIINAPPPVNPTPTNPTPTQPIPTQPKPTTTTTKPTTATTPKPNVPTASAPSANNLQISNFAVTEINYRSAVLTWDTNRPATSKVNFGGSVNNMPNEVSDPAKVTKHRLVLQGDVLRAGNKYAIRITSDDGGPVTLDGEFTTKPVLIQVIVKNVEDQAVAGATVHSNTDQGTTGEDGVVGISAPEGASIITAEKDDLRSEMTADVVLPASDDAALQEVSMVLSASNEAEGAPVPSEGNNLWKILLGVFTVGLLIVGFLLWRKRRADRKHLFGVDPKLGTVPNGDNYYPQSEAISPSPPSVPPPPHYTSLPSLVRQDLQAKRDKAATPVDEPKDMFSTLDQQHKPPEIKTVHLAQPTPPKPKAPEPKPEPKPEHHAEPKPKPEEPKKSESAEKPKEEHHRKQVEVDPKDHSLRIHHDN